MLILRICRVLVDRKRQVMDNPDWDFFKSGKFMQPLREILVEMEEVLDRLIENAERLHELSKQVILEDEVESLQKAQNQMLTKLTDLDNKRSLAGDSISEIENPVRRRIDEKIDVFQGLNDRFIENLSATRGLIHFEDDRIKKTDKKSEKERN